MRIAVRMDDITPDMDWERFYQFKALLDRYQVKPLIGVVPNNQDKMLNANSQQGKPEDFWAYIRSLQEEGWVIAMHGLNHIYTTGRGGIFPLNRFSEFAGLPLEKQKEMIRQGKEILKEEQIYTDIFMAPGHSYDKQTLTALNENGFHKITDGFGSKSYTWKNITFYPISFHLGMSLKRKKGLTTMVIHTNTMTDKELQNIKTYFNNPGNTEWISYKELLKEPPVNRTIFGRLWEVLTANLKHLLVKFI